MVAGAEERMLAPGCGDQNFAVLGRLRRDLLAEIDELDPPAKSDGPKTGLSEFERKLSERQSRSKASRSAKSG
jgi:hypothetical protein